MSQGVVYARRARRTRVRHEEVVGPEQVVCANNCRPPRRPTTAKKVDLHEIVNNLLIANSVDFPRNALTRVLHEYLDVEAAARGNADYGERT